MGSMITFGLGIMLGVVVAFPAARRYERARHSAALGAVHFGEARVHARGAVVPMVALVALFVVGALIAWAGS